MLDLCLDCRVVWCYAGRDKVCHRHSPRLGRPGGRECELVDHCAGWRQRRQRFRDTMYERHCELYCKGLISLGKCEDRFGVIACAFRETHMLVMPVLVFSVAMT